MIHLKSLVSTSRLLAVLITLMAPLLTADGVAAEDTADQDVRKYENPRFGFTVSWSSPWLMETELTDPELSLEGVVLYSGSFRVLVSALPGRAPAEVIELTVERQQQEVPDTRVVAQDQQRDVATLTLEYEGPVGLRRGYVESRPLDGLETTLLVGLDGPVDRFDLMFADAVAGIAVDGGLLFTGVPAGGKGDARDVLATPGAAGGEEPAELRHKAPRLLIASVWWSGEFR